MNVSVSQIDDFYLRFCRICGSKDGICVNFFSENGRGYLLKVHENLNVKITPTDPLPKNICHVCMSFVTDLDTFRKKCDVVQVRLTELADKWNKPKEPDDVESTRNLANRTPVQNPLQRTQIRPTIDNGNRNNLMTVNSISNPVPNKPRSKSVDLTPNPVANSNGPKLKSPLTNNTVSNAPQTKPTNSTVVLDSNEPKPSSSNTGSSSRITIAETNQMLFVCNKCPVGMFLKETALQEHQRKHHSITPLPNPTLSIKNDATNRKRRASTVSSTDEDGS